jgi:hypothetical protein
MKVADLDAELLRDITRRSHDPLGFVQYAFPWGQKGTKLEKMYGPQMWQAQELTAIGAAMSTGNRKQRRAVASGKGIGKSALISFIALWGLSTFEDTKIVITAGTETQLASKLMPEIAKWFALMINKHWFKFTATSIYVADPEVERQKAWRLDAIPWNATKPEAFQGLHNQGKRIIVLFDEASQIDDKIWDATDGAMSDADTEVLWIAYGNPTRGIGKFREAFEPDSRWVTRNIDSRTVSITDKEELQKTVDMYGEDHDIVRWTIKGEFPRAASNQFIPMDIVQQAQKNEPIAHLDDPLVLGVDVARYGDAKSVICPRKGRDCRSIPWRTFSKISTMQLANEVADMWRLYKADAVHVDGGGVGGGVVDRLREMNVPVVEVQFGGASDRAMPINSKVAYVNKRSEMWGTLREMLPLIAIPEGSDLRRELTSQLYGYRKDNEIQLVSKEVMKSMYDVDSPDLADALALTFAYPVQKTDRAGGQHRTGGDRQGKALTEYDMFASL